MIVFFMFVYYGAECVLLIIWQSHSNDIQNISGHWNHSTPFYIYFIWLGLYKMFPQVFDHVRSMQQGVAYTTRRKIVQYCASEATVKIHTSYKISIQTRFLATQWYNFYVSRRTLFSCSQLNQRKIKESIGSIALILWLPVKF